MVIQEESESPVEIAVIRKPEILEPKKYLMISNHIRELPNNTSGNEASGSSSDRVPDLSETESKTRTNISRKSKKRKLDCDVLNPTQISESDLTELRTVYQSCLAVIKKIESKYGHLLNIDNSRSSRLQMEYDNSSGKESDKETCNCTRNKKIVFDDDGQQYLKEIEDHICPIMPKRYDLPADKCSVETDSEDFSISLPSDLPSLGDLLKDPSLKNRNKVIDKMRLIKEDYLNELRFNRPALIQAIRKDPEEVLGFIGVNLSSLPGYL